jgi:hypothetical protein
MANYTRAYRLSEGFDRLFIAVIISAIKEDRGFILKGEGIYVLADYCGVDSKVCDCIKNKVAKLKHNVLSFK